MSNFVNLLVMLFCPFFLASYILSLVSKRKAAIYGGAVVATVLFCFAMDQVTSPSLGEIIARGTGYTVGGFFYLACWKYFIDRLTSKIENSAFTIWPIVGLIIPGIGFLVGWKYLTIGPAKNSEPSGTTPTGPGKDFIQKKAS